MLELRLKDEQEAKLKAKLIEKIRPELEHFKRMKCIKEGRVFAPGCMGNLLETHSLEELEGFWKERLKAKKNGTNPLE